MSDDQRPPTDQRERLWTPWRMRYIASGTDREPGCVFCTLLAQQDDVESLILHRGEHAFVIMNRFPYNSGHIMILPNAHRDDPTMLDAGTIREMAELMPVCVRALRRVFACQGLNVGYNIGSAAGAGIAEHLHQHIVPRWNGDANFMPVLASTIAMPELLPASYAKIRAELDRELHGTSAATVVMLTDNDRCVVTRAGSLPVVTPDPDQPVWRAAVAPFRGWMDEIEIAGWGGAVGVNDEPRQTVIVLRGTLSAIPMPDEVAIVPSGELDARDLVDRAITRLGPSIAAPPFLS